MKALVGAFNQEKALVGAFLVIVQPVVEPMDRFTALIIVCRVVGEMFHQIRMYTCIAYMVANIFFLLGDTDLCEDRHNNMALSMALMFFYQAALWCKLSETMIVGCKH